LKVVPEKMLHISMSLLNYENNVCFSKILPWKKFKARCINHMLFKFVHLITAQTNTFLKDCMLIIVVRRYASEGR